METENAEVNSPQNEVAIEDASTNDLREALGLTEAPSTEEVPATQEVAAEETAHHDQPTGEGEQPTDEGIEIEGEEDRLAKRRIRPRNEMDQQVIDLYRSEGFSGSFEDASRIIYQTDYPQAQESPQETEAPQPDPFDGQVHQIRQEIAQLEQQVDKAAEELETTEALKLQREVMKREMALQGMYARRERQEEAQRYEAQNYHQQRSVESRDRVYDQYPELADDTTVARKQFDDFVSQAQDDPDYDAVFQSPMWPELMASQFSARLAASQQQAPQAPPLQAPQLGTQARVLTTGTAAQPATAPLTAAGVENALPNLSTEDLYKLLGTQGGAQPHR
jgi:hypothetical protein